MTLIERCCEEEVHSSPRFYIIEGRLNLPEALLEQISSDLSYSTKIIAHREAGRVCIYMMDILPIPVADPEAPENNEDSKPETCACERNLNLVVKRKARSLEAKRDRKYKARSLFIQTAHEILFLDDSIEIAALGVGLCALYAYVNDLDQNEKADLVNEIYNLTARGDEEIEQRIMDRFKDVPG